ncbi:MAG: hypothetical protein ACPL0B_02430, partial [Anaerolineales bacterium]
MKMKYIIVYFIFFILGTCSITSATDYYVDASMGNDSWTGTAPVYLGGNDGPWKSLSKVNSSNFLPGDSINLKRGGIWFESLIIAYSGSSDNYITIRPYGSGDNPIIHGGTLVTSWSGPDNNGVYKSSGWCAWLLEDNVALKKASSEICFDGNWFFNPISKIIYYRPTNNILKNHKVFIIKRGSGIAFTNSSSYIIIDGIKFIGLGIYKGSADINLNNIIVNNCIFNNSLNGIWIDIGRHTSYYHNILIYNNIFNYCRHNIYLISQTAPYHGFRNIVIRNNQMLNSNGLVCGERWIATGDADGISLQNLRDSIIEYNDISGHCDGIGGITHWIANGYAGTGNIIRYNYIHDIKGAGIANDACTFGTANCQIYGNIISNFGTGSSGPYGGIRLNRAQTSSKHSLVSNNTICNGDIGIYFNALTDYYNIVNNIIYNMRLKIIRSNGPLL